MSFPEDSLAAGEKVVTHLHPHWKAMIMPVLWTAVAVAAVVAGSVFVFGSTPVAFYGIAALAGLFFLWRGFAPFIVWRSTHYVFTNKHVLYRRGVFSREERGIALTKVSDVRSDQNLLERILGCGTMTVESAGEQGQTNFKDIPHIIQNSVLLRQLVEEDEDSRTLDEGEMESILERQRHKDSNS